MYITVKEVFKQLSQWTVIMDLTHSAGLFPFMENMRSSVLGEGVSLSPANRGNAALEELFSSEEEAELWERWGTWRLR